MFKTEFANVRAKCPLIHNITNYVTVNDCANMVLACGASPIMADDAAEVLPDKNALWLVYCRTGRRSADAVQKLESLGYTNLRDLGGILSWPYEIEGDFEGHF